MSDKFYTLKDISSLLQTPIPYLRKLIKEHKLKGKFLGRLANHCQVFFY